MKNVNYVINGVLAIAVVILFIMQFSGNKKSDTSKMATPFSDEQAIGLPVAYINVDALLDKYYFSIDLREQMVKKEEDATALLNQEMRKFQTDLESFQYRYQNNAFTSQQRVDQEQQRLERQRNDLQALNDKLTTNLLEESQRMNLQMRDTIVAHLKEYNQAKRFQIIFSNTSSNITDPILIADDVYNITDEVVEFLNRKWLPAKQ